MVESRSECASWPRILPYRSAPCSRRNEVLQWWSRLGGEVARLPVTLARARRLLVDAARQSIDRLTESRSRPPAAPSTPSSPSCRSSSAAWTTRLESIDDRGRQGARRPRRPPRSHGRRRLRPRRHPHRRARQHPRRPPGRAATGADPVSGWVARRPASRAGRRTWRSPCRWWPGPGRPCRPLRTARRCSRARPTHPGGERLVLAGPADGVGEDRDRHERDAADGEAGIVGGDPALGELGVMHHGLHVGDRRLVVGRRAPRPAT